MGFAIYGVLSIVACWITGDWRKTKEYYPTALYFVIGNLTYNFLVYGNPLWRFGGIFDIPILTITIMVLAYPSTTILYLAHYPSTRLEQGVYVAFWAIFFTLIEWISYLFAGFEYYNGWNIFWSLLFDILMFILLRLHYKKPVLVWPISAVLCFGLLWWFRIPIFQ